MSNKQLVRAGLLALYIAALITPIAVFFSSRGGLTILNSLQGQALLQVLFPLLGLIAFTLVTFQVLITTNLWWLDRVWPGVIKYHRFQGIFALLFALSHPLFILLGYGLADYWARSFIADDQKPLLLPAYAGLSILILTVTTALLAWHGKNLPYWRNLHRFNYLAFALLWTHSWFIGTDTQSSNLKFLWLIYLLAVIVSVAGKYIYAPSHSVQEPKAV